MPSPLTNRQKFELSQLARRVWEREREAAELVGVAFEISEADFRHQEVALASAKNGLRCCSQADYLTVKAHFIDRMGDSERAFKLLMREWTNDRRQAWWKLRAEVAAAVPLGITMAYVGSICRRQFRCTLAEASEKQLWCLIYTTRSRAAAKRKQREEGKGQGARGKGQETEKANAQ